MEWQNVMIPQLGKAGMPYAKSIRTTKALHGAKPDPGLLFDCLFYISPASCHGRDSDFCQ